MPALIRSAYHRGANTLTLEMLGEFDHALDTLEKCRVGH
jgi:hypothetical protein